MDDIAGFNQKFIKSGSIAMRIMRHILILFVPVALLIVTAPNTCFASREDTVLSPDYQIESEKEGLKDKLSWEIGYSYGLSNVPRLLGLGAERFEEDPTKEYLDTLGMVDSKNDSLLTIGANYLATPKLEFSIGIPLSIVLAKIETGDRRHKTSLQIRPAVGDIYGSVSYALLPETKYRPLVIATYDINSALSKYTSMGDGFWGFTPGVYLRKFVSGQLYLLGLGGYTHRLERNGAKPGSSIRYGAGVGILSGNKKIELNLERAKTAETKINEKTIKNSEEDLTISIEFTTILGSRTSTIGLFLSGLEKGLNWGQNTVGAFLGLTF